MNNAIETKLEELKELTKRRIKFAQQDINIIESEIKRLFPDNNPKGNGCVLSHGFLTSQLKAAKAQKKRLEDVLCRLEDPGQDNTPAVFELLGI